MVITSTAFENGESIPIKYSCDSQDISPELTWSGVPEGTQSFALILDDPDAPGGTFTHWIIFNIPADMAGLVENVPKVAVQDSIRQGANGFAAIGYGGPCPPPGPAHRYVFTLYALDTVLDDLGRPSKAELERAMAGHILAQAKLMGTYQKH